jgi:hypothetical protein
MLRSYFSFILILLFFSFAQAKDQELCPNIILKDGKFKLNKNEKVLVCGEGELESWRNVPFEQSQYHLKILFQNLGYFEPKFTVEGNRMTVEMGDQTKIDHWDFKGSPEAVEQRKKRKVLHEVLTPAKLNEIEKWIDNELKAQGYACPEVKSKAQVWNHTVESNYLGGNRLFVASLERLGMDNLDLAAFKRYEAFEVNEIYDNRKLQITSNRLLTDGLVQSSYFTQKCSDTGVALVHHMEIGEPRILRVSFGASTEELPFLEVWYKNTRLDGMASSYWVRAHASPILESIEGNSELYILPFSKRTFLGPRFIVSREIENSYERLNARSGVDLGRNWDWKENRFGLRAGPTVNYVNTIRGFGPDDISYLTIQGNLTVMDYEYELLSGEQIKGYQGNIEYIGQRHGLGSPVSADRWNIRGKYLWDLRELSPPLLVLGTRFEGSLTTSDAIERTTENDVLPQEYRIYLGGEQNLRGFPRQSINNRNLGYVTSLYLGFDLRLIETLPWNLEPLVLWDGAQAGETPGRLGNPFFQSYGLGMRWRSPFGPIRVSAAKGYVMNGDASTADYPNQWVFLFSFGREF